MIVVTTVTRRRTTAATTRVPQPSTGVATEGASSRPGNATMRTIVVTALTSSTATTRVVQRGSSHVTTTGVFLTLKSAMESTTAKTTRLATSRPKCVDPATLPVPATTFSARPQQSALSRTGCVTETTTAVTTATRTLSIVAPDLALQT